MDTLEHLTIPILANSDSHSASPPPQRTELDKKITAYILGICSVFMISSYDMCHVILDPIQKKIHVVQNVYSANTNQILYFSASRLGLVSCGIFFRKLAVERTEAYTDFALKTSLTVFIALQIWACINDYGTNQA